MDVTRSNEWMHCSLCRSGRQGTKTLRKARQRQVEWKQPNDGLFNPVQDPVVYTSLDDAFASMMQFMTISTRKCGRYHNSHKPHTASSPEDKHTIKYHSVHPRPVTISNRFPSSPTIEVNGSPGTYSITAGRWTTSETSSTTKHVVRVEPGQSVSLTLTV